MDNKEHIDRLYQEKFKDFEVTPHPRVWENIEASLQKKKRRVFPIWWLSGGAVATLLIGLLLFPFSSEKQPNKPNKEEIIITESEQIPPKNTLKELPIEKQEKNDTTIEVVATKTPTHKLIEKSIKSKNLIKKNQQKPSIFNTTEIATVTEKIIEENRYKDNKISTEDYGFKKTKVLEGKNKNTDKKIDTTIQILVPKKTKKLLAINDEKEENKKDKRQKKWSVTPSVAFLNSGSFSKSSPLGENLDNNSISGENSYSYGVKMGYKINEKWEIQSGIHLQEVLFSTQNVAFENSAQDEKLNINYFRDEELQYAPSPNIPTRGNSEGSGFEADNATVNQSLGYIEIPVEVKYTLFRKSKLSTQLVTGVSSLILSKNELGAKSTDFSGFIGEASNLNTLNFSGNIGFDINYKVLDKLQLNLNPMFKQQFNTFSKKSNGFKPYTIGIYTGIKYEF